MSAIKLVTVSDDRHGRKGGRYKETQSRIAQLLDGWIPQYHWMIEDIIDCDPLMKDIDAAKNGRVYKPYVILQELMVMNDGDFLIYNDCSPELWPEGIDIGDYDVKVIKRLTRACNDFLVGFVKWDTKHIGAGEYGIHTHDNFTLDSCIETMQGEPFRHSFLCASGMICIRKTEATVHIVKDWLKYNRMPECSCMNVHETEDSYFSGRSGRKLGNRHDQSVLSMLLNQANANYCAIAYNDLNPYNFLNFCLPEHDYQFINSNINSKNDRQHTSG